ncbi:MAG TPA: elongation factor P maturation arginine rhamnosyltransferase EarP, partial [Thiobacillus sp.]|nr:elongation factor P maturation arginine rhamnosyltransferase EarP [Thiobacillus sp.]
PQADAVHWDKTHALLMHYTDGLDEAAARALIGMWRHWNGMPEAEDVAACWTAWRAQQAAIEAHAAGWCDRLGHAGRLTDKLVDFVENKLK